MSFTTRCILCATVAVTLAPTANAQKITFTHSDAAYKDAAGKQLSAPEGVACGADGTVVVADTGTGRLIRYQLANGVLTGGKASTHAQIKHPVRAHMSSSGVLLVLDRRSNAILRVSDKDTVSGAVKLSGVDGADDVVIGSFALDASDNLYVLDLKAERVLVANAAGAVARQLALPDDAGVVTDIAVDKSGAIYAADAAKLRLYKATKDDKAFATVAADLSKELTYPTHLAMNPTRTMLIVTDRNGSGLLLLGLDGASLGRRLGMGTREGFVYYPSQVCMTKQGAIVITDRGNDRVQVFGAKR